MVYQIPFKKENIVDLNVAVIGINKEEWIGIKSGENITEAEIKMKRYRFDILPIQSSKNGIVGYYKTVKHGDYKKIEEREISYKDVIDYSTNIKDLIKGFIKENRMFYFISVENNISGLITDANLNCRQVLIYLFSLICEMEKKLSKFTLKEKKEKRLIKYVENNSDSGGNFKRIIKRYKEDKENGLDNSITEYFYIQDFITVLEDFKLYSSLSYSADEIEKLKNIRILRNSIAHPTKSLINNSFTIKDLWKNLNIIEDINFRIRKKLYAG